MEEIKKIVKNIRLFVGYIDESKGNVEDEKTEIFEELHRLKQAIDKEQSDLDKHGCKIYCKYYKFSSAVSCLLSEGVEFMDHEEIYEAIKKEHDVLQCKEK